jgi:hypothetical protein
MRCAADGRRDAELSWWIRVKTHPERVNARTRANAVLEIGMLATDEALIRLGAPTRCVAVAPTWVSDAIV